MQLQGFQVHLQEKVHQLKHKMNHVDQPLHGLLTGETQLG
jgi:hypothetical protein